MKLPIKIITSLIIAFTLSACGPGLVSLPDDPHNEPASTLPDEDNSSAGVIEEPSDGNDVGENPLPPLSEREQILSMYNYLDPNHIVPTTALEDAVIYFHQNKASFKNQNVISIIDYRKRSSEKRWFFIDLKTGAVNALHVSHGKGSDSNHDGYAEKFSNVSGSNATSIGFYKTAETYNGSNGYSLRLDGLSSTNSRARSRAIVVHGANYVQDQNVVQGRSWGCPAVSQANHRSVIDRIKGGSLIFAVGN